MKIVHLHTGVGSRNCSHASGVADMEERELEALLCERLARVPGSMGSGGCLRTVDAT